METAQVHAAADLILEQEADSHQVTTSVPKLRYGPQQYRV